MASRQRQRFIPRVLYPKDYPSQTPPFTPIMHHSPYVSNIQTPFLKHSFTVLIHFFLERPTTVLHSLIYGRTIHHPQLGTLHSPNTHQPSEVVLPYMPNPRPLLHPHHCLTTIQKTHTTNVPCSILTHSSCRPLGYLGT